MALTEGSSVQWADVQELYNQANIQRARWKLKAVTVPDNPGTTMPSQVQELKNTIEDLSTTTAGQIANTGVTVPARGDLLETNPFNLMETTLGKLAAANASFNSSFRSSFFASFNSSHRGSFCSFGHSDNGCDVFYSQPSCGTAARDSFTK